MIGTGKTKLRKVSVDLKTPFLSVKGDWEADESEQQAAWELYVELVTRVATVELKPGEGLLREALSSLHQLFGQTRDILRKYGPGIAKPKGEGKLSLGIIAVTVLNAALRPVLAKWHPRLEEYEKTRQPNVSVAEHEARWAHNEEVCSVLRELQTTIRDYTNLLAEVAGVPRLA